jgi:hypothetical protein|tara:strand:+ start:2534 stop:2839 length:306 start_codon:yes stop_codon:yes gene_type:complete
MGTINFIVTADTEEHVFNKNTFKYMFSSYSSGTTGTISIFFAAEGDIVDPDQITLTVRKEFMSDIIRDISQNLNKSGHTEVQANQTSAPFSFVTAIVYTAG